MIVANRDDGAGRQRAAAATPGAARRATLGVALGVALGVSLGMSLGVALGEMRRARLSRAAPKR